MTTSHELSPYTGTDPHRVFLAAIEAKVSGDLTDAQYDALVTSLQSVPAQRVTAHPISAPTPSVDEVTGARSWQIMGLRIHNPVVLGIALVLIAAVAVTLSVVVVIGLIGAVTWAKANAAIIGAAIIVIIVAICVILGMLAKMRNSQAEANHARAARYAYQQPVHVNIEQ